MGRTHLATIVHLTDLHLCVDADGASLSVEQRTKVARVLRRVHSVYERIAGHEEDPWDSLKSCLGDIIERESASGEGAPVLVVQTGDVEAVGGLGPWGSNPYDRFTGFKALHALRDSISNQLHARGISNWAWIDIYGNHDTWGRPPIPDPNRVDELALLDG